MSDQVQIMGIHGFGHHGVFEHEQKIGQDFYVDVILHLDLIKASRSDLLEDTIDYAEVCDLVVAEISGPPVSLIEKLAGQIGDLLLAKYALLKTVIVTVHKPQAPVDAEILDIAVAIERSR
jgi:dihydroneopterin aldolase